MKKSIKVIAATLLLGTVLAGCDDPTSGDSTSTSTSPSTSASTSMSSPSTSTSTSTSKNDPVVAGVSEKKSFTEFKANKEEKEEGHKTEEFYDRDQEYLVGDDNAFNIKPIVVFVDPVTKLPVSGGNVTFNLSLYEYVNDAAVKIDDITTYVEEFNNSTCDLNFKENAIGKEFKFEIVPDGVQADKVAQFTKSMDFKVVDGFNVYDVKELSYINKRTVDGEQDEWDAFMAENGLEKKEVHALIFHNNLEITTADFPSYYLYKEGDSDFNVGDSDYERTLGSLRDNKNIYRYDFTSNDEKFALYGNYFTLDCSKIPLVTRCENKITEEGKVISHTSVIKADAESTFEGEFTIRDINVIGNAQRTEEAKRGGGVIFHKAERVITKAENIISRCWFITYFAVRKEGNYYIDECKAYDNFNSFIYNGGSNVFISNSDMTGAGGPIIIQDHQDPTKEESKQNIGRTTIDDNSHLENWVTGSEGWFDLVQAKTLVPSILVLNAIFTPYKRTFLQERIPNDKTQFFNLICVNKSGDAPAPTPGVVIKGSIKIGEDATPFDFGETNQPFAAYRAGIASVNAKAPVFQTDTNGMAFTDTKHLLTLDMSSGIPTAVAAGDPVLTGDYLAVYYGGMCLTFGYYGL